MIADYLTEHWKIAAGLCDQPLVEQVESVVAAIRKTIDCEGVIYAMGNGGSAATASHFVNDLLLLGHRAVALTDNAPVIMAIANDFEYADIFIRQLSALKGYYGDTVVAFSCSGESENVIRAVTYANEHNRTMTISFCGDPGSRLATQAQIAICVPGGVQHQEDAHLMLCHAIYCALKAAA